MRKRIDRKFTELELAVMNVVWTRGPSTVREVWENLSVNPKPTYTTLLTIMRIMQDRGYLEREERGRSHIYQAKLREQPVKRGLLRDLIDRVFHGSAEALMVRMIEDNQLTPEELRRVLKLLQQKEKEE